MAKQSSDFRYNTGATKVPWAAVGENYNVHDLMEIIRFLMQGEGKEYDDALEAVWEQVKNLARRFEYAAMYDKAFDGMKGIKAIPVNTEERRNSYCWYPILIDLDVVSITAKDFIKELIAMGIPCSGILWPESYLEQAYQDGIGFGDAKFPFKSTEYTNPASAFFCCKMKTARSLKWLDRGSADEQEICMM